MSSSLSPSPVLFVPGTLCNARLFAPQQAYLSDRGIESMVASLDGGNTITAMASRILADAPPTFALAGLSMGGIIAFEIMRQAPERVTHLALLDTNSRAETPEKLTSRLLTIDAIDKLELDGSEGLIPFVEYSLFPNYTAASEPQLSQIKQTVLCMAAETTWPVGKAQMQALNTRTDSVATLANIRIPTTIICGAQDKLCSIERHTFIAQHIPHAHLEVLPECGHLSTLERPELVNPLLLQWLQMEHHDECSAAL